VREFGGLYGAAFEASVFREGYGHCPAHGGGWWLEPNRDFLDRYDELTSGRSPFEQPYGGTTTYIVETRFVGRLSPPGSYGHLGDYSRQVDVLELQHMTDTDLCDMQLPDLALAAYRHGWTDREPSGCVRGGPGSPTLELEIINQGRQPTVDSWIDLWSGTDLVARLRLCRLDAQESRDMMPVLMPVGRIELDAEDDVTERFEENNRVSLRVPTFTPPPTCSPLPPGWPTVTPKPSATLQDCITPTTTPTPSVTPTRDPLWTDTPTATSAPWRVYLPFGARLSVFD
jgi:hypothetical protein